MNINDVVDVEYDGCKLTALFAKQKQLMQKYRKIERDNGIIIPQSSSQFLERLDVPLQSHLGQDHIKRVIWWMVEEIGEAANCLKNKPWKKTQVEVDVAHFKEELADAFHFFIELLITCGISATEITELYLKKSAVNEFRQRSEY